jgi:1-aminocyclopropane-1-carboxylate deaminase/D-cysteine desulfhydrase-like pyridoxal-dependent ACC family enzyme
MPRLSKLLVHKLWIKRDDLTGLALGGNKTRKLEFLCAEALRLGADTLITTGAPQSNHCRQTAAAAAKLGLRCVLVLTGDPQSADSGNLLLDSLVGAELVWAGEKSRDHALEETFAREQTAGRNPYLIPYGGSNPLGAAAYALAIRELRDQEIRPDWIIFASSSGGTQAGMVLGARWFGFSGRIQGISVDWKATPLRAKSARWSRRRSARWGMERPFPRTRFSWTTGFWAPDTARRGNWSEKRSICSRARRESF